MFRKELYLLNERKLKQYYHLDTFDQTEISEGILEELIDSGVAYRFDKWGIDRVIKAEALQKENARRHFKQALLGAQSYVSETSKRLVVHLNITGIELKNSFRVSHSDHANASFATDSSTTKEPQHMFKATGDSQQKFRNLSQVGAYNFFLTYISYLFVSWNVFQLFQWEDALRRADEIALKLKNEYALSSPGLLLIIYHCLFLCIG